MALREAVIMGNGMNKQRAVKMKSWERMNTQKGLDVQSSRRDSGDPTAGSDARYEPTKK